MKTNSISPEDFRGVFAVPPLARRRDATRSLDLAPNDLIVRHIVSGGITRLIYGGNAFLYHITLAEYEELLEWLAGLSDQLWIIPSIGPSYGRAMDQAKLLRLLKCDEMQGNLFSKPLSADGVAEFLQRASVLR